ncbi:glycosyl hydrolase family 18 protein [Cohnella lupini]|uniref:Glycosyl hydrolase family 18 (Putative chitinase) n=1 Tax=Cohnella lupini TaxID=1294267 RepID=A0A3D9IIR0_9BACL|nr:glycosyl hydrolase family 18 protein [Cohnella lupini]RED61595.1 glycosyl hydrolase family 18 (putative chitinase) [Cohnella lupini]
MDTDRKRFVALFAITIAFVVAVVLLYLIRRETSNEAQATVAKVPEKERRISAWIADWHWESGLTDLKAVARKLDSLQVFSAYFDDRDRLFFTEEAREGLPEIVKAMRMNGDAEIYLTLVNDILYSDGSEIQKDSDIISRLMATEESRTKHIEDIVTTMDAYGFHGVEIDYEKIADVDWENVVDFISSLCERLNPSGRTMRVVLEPRAPIESLRLPEGPAYVMMAYNLFGNHSGPGPKADHNFIKKLTARMNSLPGDPYVALSTGGFDWVSETGEATGITEQRAVELSRLSSVSPKRDSGSGSVFFDYIDDNGIEHTVWYADDETLSQWIETASQAGYTRIAIWRLGELSRDTLAVL